MSVELPVVNIGDFIVTKDGRAGEVMMIEGDTVLFWADGGKDDGFDVAQCSITDIVSVQSPHIYSSKEYL